MEPLFTTTTDYTFEEYKRFNRTVRNKILHMNRLIGVIILMILLLAVMVDKPSIKIGLFIGAMISPFAANISASRAAKKAYDSNKLVQGCVSNFSFYTDRVEQNNEIGHTTISYDKLYRIIETKTNFYIMIAKNQGFIIVKENCSEQLAEYIRGLKKQAVVCPETDCERKGGR